MADPRARRRALLALLPRVFAGQPEGSSLAGVIDTMAAALAELDAGLTRTQRDHWLKLASGEASDSEVSIGQGASALERLGALLGIDRLDGEETEAYRSRLFITARVLTRGVNTPRALLELAIATLGAEPCARIEKHLDTTIGYGLPPGTIERCPVCRAGKAATECPNVGTRVLEAWITDNPPQAQRLVVSPQPRPGMRFAVENASLDEDVPAVRLKAVEQTTSYPCLHNRATGEIMLYAGTLQPDEVLSVWPQVDLEETRRYESHDGNLAHHWRDQYPSGSAVIIDPDGKNQRIVNASIYYLTGAFFAAPDADPDDPGLARFASAEASEGARFADALSDGSVFDTATLAYEDDDQNNEMTARFGASGQQVRTPRVRPGADLWAYRVLTRTDVAAITGAMAGPVVDNAPEQPGEASVELTLSWWARRPASFRLSIPRSTWVGQAETRGSARMLSRWIQQARAAGIVAALDFPEPKRREQAALGERVSWQTRQQWRESLPATEGPLTWTTQSKNREAHPLTDAVLAWRAVFDNTRLDASRFD
ncbi:MAG: hypothetical protein DVS81_02735 [Candidatus Accumulibacter meliphilus]|jgi:hypothetical protein|uniref:Uncharacterized protein n=1 Tax=Candidatus Accumulibacter meliphilus TaxID=2211374 RepID=A0A369XQA4_9PROT|nr:MAG: hypothetical protein DVS81_02735 [Candidatus Accumulibacter meliphilus]